MNKTRLIEIDGGDDVKRRIKELKAINSKLVVAVRIALDASGIGRALELAKNPDIEVLHLVADLNGNQIGTEKSMFVKDMVRQVHNSLVKSGIRDEITIIAGGGIAMAEHLTKQIICGADVVSIDLPLLVSLECRLCDRCQPDVCPAKIGEVEMNYGLGRMTNLLAAWHDQLIEVMGAMGIREVRRMRGEVGRAMFFEDLEEETFGKLFGARKRA